MLRSRVWHEPDFREAACCREGSSKLEAEDLGSQSGLICDLTFVSQDKSCPFSEPIRWVHESLSYPRTDGRYQLTSGLPWWLSSKESACSTGATDSIPGSGRSPGGRMATHSGILAWRIPVDREAWLVGYSSWGPKELDTTEATWHACMPVAS